MPRTQWTMSQIKQCETTTGQAMLSNEHSLVFYASDFGQIIKSNPMAAFMPESVEALQFFMAHAHQYGLPVTIRGNGLSQGGQSQSVDGGVTLHMQQFNKVDSPDETSIWVDANASFADILKQTLPLQKVPLIIPYNCGLTVAGVISAGGMGAASFRHGNIAANVKALEVITASGEHKRIDESDELFHACLGGQGQFAVIYRVCLHLRPCKRNARTFCLLYADESLWLSDLKKAMHCADAIEAFCTPAVQGTKQVQNQRRPFAHWFYALHVTMEYDDTPPKDCGLTPWKLLHQQDEGIGAYFHRHDSRFVIMKKTGQWDLPHPWYECFLQEGILRDKLDTILSQLPVHFANVLHVVPVARKADCGFFMLPEGDMVFEVMVLNPGTHPVLLEDCLQTIDHLDNLLLPTGGKRYLSGYLGDNLGADYWKRHFAKKYADWQRLKRLFDSQGILRSRHLRED